MYINFSDIPGNSNLFLDYLYEFKNVEKYYVKNFKNKNDYLSTFEDIKNRNFNRKKLVNIIRKQYQGFSCSSQTDYNHDLLEKENTIAVVTGQQLGLFGGPLYTFYKIITAIKLCSTLKSTYYDYNFVPVFWLEGDDHDFEEVSYFNLINKDNEIQQFEYDDGLEPDTNRGSVGNIKFNKNINSIFKELDESIRGTEFTDKVLDLYYSCYNDNSTFKSSFRKLMTKLFDEYGLILFDPQDKKIKEMLTPVFKTEIDRYREHSLISIERSADLEELYHAQVKVKPINLFISDETGRHLLEPTDDDMFRLKGKKKKLNLEDLYDLLESEPENFSPNVILRPICQDYILPTGLYIGGPGEISYFAQVIPFYEKFNVTQPILYPRASATIVEKPIKKIIEKYNINFNEFYLGEKVLIEKVIRELEETPVKHKFKIATEQIDDIFNNLVSELVSIDEGLKELTHKTKQKVIQSISNLEAKTEKAQERKYDTTIRQIGKAIDIITPYGNLQERELNFFYFANKYGLDFLNLVYNQLFINKFEHQIIEL